MKLLKLAPFCAAMALCATSAGARDFTIAGWGGNYQDAQRAAYFEPFAAQQGGLKFIETTYLGGLAELKTMADTGNVIWDLVIADGPTLQLGCDEGLLEPLDWDAIGGKDTLMPEAVTTCGAGNVVIGNGFAFNAETFPEGPKNWADFFDLQKFPGKRGIKNDPMMNLEYALMADGVPPDQVYEVLATPEGVDRAFAQFDKIKGELQYWDAGSQPVEWLAANNVAMSTAYNGRIIMAAKEGKPLSYVWTNQIYNIDAWAVPANSPFKDQAMAFIKVANNAENQAKFSSLMPYGPTNTEVVGLLPSEVAKNLPAGENIKDSLFMDDAFWTDHKDELTERWNNWATH
ncbi:MAG: ABC transporter substrate-binding protein [Paracoccaceae bacterium]